VAKRPVAALTDEQTRRVEGAYRKALMQSALDEAERLGNGAAMDLLGSSRVENELRKLFEAEFKDALHREIKRMASAAAKRAYIALPEDWL
jgi:hypothetical protein